MSHWNYRVTRTRIEQDAVEEYLYDIREVYYGAPGDVIEGMGWTADPIAPHGDTPDELRAGLALMGQAFERPILDVTDEDNPFEVTR